jgi:recombination protein RecT
MSEQGPVQTQALVSIDTVRDLFEKNKGELEAALPRHLTADRMLRIVMTEVRKNPDLLDCDKRSLFGAVIQSAQLGLEPGSALGHAYLIPFWNGKKKIREVQFMPGYRGYIDLVGRSGRVSHIVARVVREGDQFDWRYGIEERLEHIPEGDEGELTHVYAIAFLKDGGHSFEVLTRNQVDAIRKRSKASDSGPWVTDYDEMARKSAVRKLFKYLPVSIEIQRAVGLDDMAEAGISQDNENIIELNSEDFGPPEVPNSGKKVHRVKVARSTDQVGQAQSATPDPKPAPAVSPNPAPGSFESTPASVHEPKPRPRAAIMNSLFGLGAQNGLKPLQVNQWLKDAFKKEVTQVTDAELERAEQMLEQDIAQKAAGGK